MHRERSTGRGREIFDVLEQPNWAPWLRFSAEQLDAQADVFPQGQILVCDDDSRPVASLSTNRIDWDGDVDQLPTWDVVAGRTHAYEDTFRPSGNTIVLMSVNVGTSVRGLRLTDVLVHQIQALAADLGIRHLISDFRPSEYGARKAAGDEDGFEMYCSRTRGDGLPVDAWLRSLVHKGMRPLKVDPQAMVVEAELGVFDGFRALYRPEAWYRVTDESAARARLCEHNPSFALARIDELWECSETGTWYIDRGDRALYVESNLWGELPVATYP